MNCNAITEWVHCTKHEGHEGSHQFVTNGLKTGWMDVGVRPNGGSSAQKAARRDLEDRIGVDA